MSFQDDFYKEYEKKTGARIVGGDEILDKNWLLDDRLTWKLFNNHR